MLRHLLTAYCAAGCLFGLWLASSNQPVDSSERLFIVLGAVAIGVVGWRTWTGR